MKITRYFIGVLVLALACLTIMPAPAMAGEGATIVFRSGQVIKLDDGFRQLADTFKNAANQADAPRVIELSLGGSSFLLNVSEIVLLCRDRCSNMTVVHQLDPQRGGARTNIQVDPVIIDRPRRRD